MLINNTQETGSSLLRPESQLEKKNSALAMMKINYDETYDVIAVKLFQNV